MSPQRAWHQHFERFAHRSATVIGSPYAFIGMCGLTLLWLVLGPFLGWSDTWQITYTAALTVATQFTAMLIQATATRQERAIQMKLDELIRAIGPADNRMRGIEELSERSLDAP